MNIIGKQKILLPKNADMSKWAVIACDQFTAQPKYWQKLSDYIGDAPSCLHITLPEIYLDSNVDERVKRINLNMQKYLDDGIFQEIDGFVLVEREVENGRKRAGLVLSVDLDCYDWRRVRSPIRATEDTIVERLPARVDIRRGAKIELPHILLLIDDKDKKVIEPVYQNRHKLKKLYDFELNMGGGHIKGYEVKNTEETAAKLNELLDPQTQIQKYGFDAGILFAVGDGNHSLAAAKARWEEVKPTLSQEQRQNHPLRYALVEVVNLYDDAMVFEPIHRVMLNCDISFVEQLRKRLSGKGKLTLLDGKQEFTLDTSENAGQTIKQVQLFIEEYIKNNPAKVDYVHGVNHLKEVVGENKNSIGIIMPTFEKDQLFNYVLNVGNLPKKAFSIGEPERKRYYLESKKIV